MMAGMDLAEFLTARLDEDERAAQALDGAHWWAATNVGDEYNFGVVQDREPEAGRYALGERIASCGVEGLDDGDRRAEHIARHSPARVLAEVAAKRRIVELHGGDEDSLCALCIAQEAGWGNDWIVEREPVPCPTLRVLALPYAEHPDYSADWAPHSM